MTDERILVIDDEEAILKVVEHALATEGFQVHTAHDATSAESCLDEVEPALVILDVVLPDRSGLEFARDLRARSDVPIVILSARATEIDRILGLEMGADDYVTKPFSPRELVSRVKVILRRAAAARAEGAPIVVGGLTVDTLARQASVDDEAVHLTHTEYEILRHLAQHAGTAFSREEILAALGENARPADARAIDVHIHNIREKVESDPRSPTYLLTVRGIGYRLREP
jgi:DNA-binding response OmpR family regulator